MARIKYDPAATPLTKKHYGYTFLNSSIGKSMAPGQRNNRTRYPNQSLRQQNNQRCIREWRNMDPATVANWNAFAAAYQQPTKRDPAVFLSGYQLFLKRNSYCFLNHGIESAFMETPTMESIAAPEPTFEIKVGENIVDVTDLYIHNFGIIPQPGQWLLFWAVPYSDTSGQFFAPIHATLECEEVFIDGLFLNLVIPDGNQNITYSVYLSKPVHAGSNYGGTKIRYMGCFTTKSFLGLTDTPGSYAGQAGKVPTVNLAENALEFAAGGGGGLTCEDLPACPTIIDINSNINNINETIVLLLNTSMPPVNYGTIYNPMAYGQADKITSSDEWDLPTFQQWINLTTFLGVSPAFKLRETGTTFWGNASGTNTVGFNARGAGRRAPYTGIYSLFRSEVDFWGSGGSPDNRMVYQISSGSSNPNYTNMPKSGGCSIRLLKISTTLPEGGVGYYNGNDGKHYRTKVINGIEYTTDSLNETLLRSGAAIPEVTDANIWKNLLTPARSYPNNDPALA